MDGLWFHWAAAGSPRSAHEPLLHLLQLLVSLQLAGRQQLQSNSKAGVCPAG